MSPCTYIILVNWNGWKDTLECLESIFHLSNTHYRVLVCDNGSEDSSLEHIQQWAEGSQKSETSSSEMHHYSSPAIEKPIKYQLMKLIQAENNSVPIKSQLVLINCEKNLGFAGGNNVGIRLALQQHDMDTVWLLNNDSVAHPQALIKLRKKMNSTANAGIIGSKIRYYYSPDRVQAFGGARFFPFIGMAMHIGRFRNLNRQINEAKIERQLKYVMGASMFVTRAFLEKVGLMQEDYFLYYEELDWAERARGQFKLAYADESEVFHKAGASINSSNKSSKRSLFSDRNLMSNRLKITRRFYPRCMLSVRLFLFVEVCIRLLHGRHEQALMIWNLMLGKQQDSSIPPS